MLPQQIGAKAVHRADMGAGQKHLLAGQPPILRMLRQQGGEGGGQPLLHFGRRRLGEGYHQKPIHVRGIVGIGDPAEDPLDEDGGFPGSRRRRYEERAARASMHWRCSVVHWPHGGSFFLKLKL